MKHGKVGYGRRTLAGGRAATAAVVADVPSPDHSLRPAVADVAAAAAQRIG